MKKALYFLLCVVIVVSTAACSQEDNKYPGLSEEEIILVKNIEKTPLDELEIYDIDDKLFSLEDYKGKTLIIQFWASWNGESETDMLYLNAFQLSSPDVVVIGVNTMEEEIGNSYAEGLVEYIKGYIEDLEYDLNMYIDKNMKAAEYLNLDSIPLNLIVDGEGNIRLRKYGAFKSTKQIRRVLELVELYG